MALKLSPTLILLPILINTSLIISANKNESCKFDPFRYHCHNITELEWIDYIEKADTRFIKCTNCTLSTLPLQKLQLITRQKLKTLMITNVTDLIRIDENTFKDCMNLENIELHNLSIEEIKPEYLTPLEDLEDLVLVNVNLTIQHNDTFKNVKNLEKLRISGAKLHSINQTITQYLIDLEIFDVSDNDITTIASNTFENNPKLKHINFYKNYITVLPLNLFDNLKKLKILNLSDNPIVNFNFEHIMSVNRKLKYLYVYDIPCPTFERTQFDDMTCKSTINTNITTSISELNKRDEITYDIIWGDSKRCDINCVSLTQIENCPENDLYKILYFKELGIEN